ncbi:MAG: hypothetical protein IKM99_05430 [Bacteroidales bacterium]|nr:hypothetical protein [Bacteroidales bacterium]
MTEVPLHPMTLTQLAARWQVSEKTVKKWIRPFREELGTIHGRIFTPQQVKIILGHLE